MLIDAQISSDSEFRLFCFRQRGVIFRSSFYLPTNTINTGLPLFIFNRNLHQTHQTSNNTLVFQKKERKTSLNQIALPILSLTTAMTRHSEQVRALTQLISSIHFSPEELLRLRFEAERGIARQDELKERVAAENWREVLGRIAACPRHDYGYDYEMYDDSQYMTQREAKPLKKERKDALRERGRSDGVGMRNIEGLSRFGTSKRS